VNSSIKVSPRHGNTYSVAHRTYIVCTLAIALLSCFINYGGINSSEVIDDHDLLHNPIARGCGRNPIVCFRRPLFGLYYRPLMGASLSVGENLHGQTPRPFHIENVCLHGAVVLEACWAFHLLFRRYRAALLAGLLYAVHPLQVPVTTFIGGRTDTLAIFFLFWFVIGAIKGTSGRHALVWRAVSILGFACAVFSKEQCLLLLFLLPLLTTMAITTNDSSSHARQPLQPWMLLFCIPIAAFLLAAHKVIPANAIDTVGWRATSTRVAWDLALRIEMVGRTLWFYTRSFVWPVPSTLHQTSLGAWDIPQPWNALGGFFGAGLWIAITRHTWPDRGMRTMTLWTAVTLLPCLNIVPIPSQFVACYRAAIPLFGIAGLVGALFDNLILASSRKMVQLLTWLLPFVAAGGLTVLSLIDVPIWQSDSVLSMAQFRADPNFLPALVVYAMSQRRAGLRREAIETNDRIVARLFPAQSTLEDRLAVIDTPWMLRNVKSQSSLRYWPRPFVNFVMRERGGGAQELGLYLWAIEDYRLALAVMPDDIEVGDSLVYCCEISGKYEDAASALKNLIKRAPTSARLQHLAMVDMHLGRLASARQNLARALACAIRERSGTAPAILRLYEKIQDPARRESKQRESHAGSAAPK
jgi:hypothetical protein